MREETRYPLSYLCVYCNQPITDFPCRGMQDGRRAHLTCWRDNTDEQGNDLIATGDNEKAGR